MYMPDALRATHELMQADKKNLTAPNVFKKLKRNDESKKK